MVCMQWSARICSLPLALLALAAATAHGVALTDQVRGHSDHASALSAHGVWNQNLLATMQRFFAENGANA